MEVVNHKMNVCKVNLKAIWETDYQQKMSFPKFKYLLYSGSEDLDFNQRFPFSTAMAIDITFTKNYESEFAKIIQGLKAVMNESVRTNSFFSEEELVQLLMKNTNIGSYKADLNKLVSFIPFEHLLLFVSSENAISITTSCIITMSNGHKYRILIFR